jgi:hypothetical protein
MPHVLEPAPSARSKCRGCGQAIQRDELRFGERLPNNFGSGEMTLWFHPLCAAHKLPQQLLEALRETASTFPDRETLEKIANRSAAHERAQRIDGAERAPSGQAACRCCREPIAKGSWRIRVVYYEEGRFAPGGFVHLTCRRAYFEADDLLDQVLRFSLTLSPSDREELARAFEQEQFDPTPQKSTL